MNALEARKPSKISHSTPRPHHLTPAKLVLLDHLRVRSLNHLMFSVLNRETELHCFW